MLSSINRIRRTKPHPIFEPTKLKPYPQMHFFHFILQISALAILLGVASAAVEIRFYRNSFNCDTSAYNYYYNVPAMTCLSDIGSYAVKFINVPPGGQGQTYRDPICKIFSQSGGSGTYCLSNNLVYSANWFYPPKKLIRRGTLGDGQPSTGLQYVTGEGKKRRISCASKDFEKISKLVEEGDYAALAEYPEGKSKTLLKLILQILFILTLTNY